VANDKSAVHNELDAKTASVIQPERLDDVGELSGMVGVGVDGNGVGEEVGFVGEVVGEVVGLLGRGVG